LNNGEESVIRAEFVNPPTKLVEGRHSDGSANARNGHAALGYVLPDIDTDIAR
jgi:hypothetical protein